MIFANIQSLFQKLCERAYQVFGETGYQPLGRISIAHLYNLGKSRNYIGQRQQYEKTRPVCSKIGERRKPNNPVLFALTASIRVTLKGPLGQLEKIKICVQSAWWISNGRGPVDNLMDNIPVAHRLTTGRPQLTRRRLIWITVINFDFFNHPETGSYPYFRLIYGLEYSDKNRPSIRTHTDSLPWPIRHCRSAACFGAVQRLYKCPEFVGVSFQKRPRKT